MKSLQEAKAARKTLVKSLKLKGAGHDLAPGELSNLKRQAEYSTRKVVKMPTMSKIKDVSFKGLI